MASAQGYYIGESDNRSSDWARQLVSIPVDKYLHLLLLTASRWGIECHRAGKIYQS